ncbi:unnamed protein product, partial [Didymodactylos carnosus]
MSNTTHRIIIDISDLPVASNKLKEQLNEIQNRAEEKLAAAGKTVDDCILKKACTSAIRLASIKKLQTALTVYIEHESITDVNLSESGSIMDSFTAVGAQVSNNTISVPIPGNVSTARFDLESENVAFAYESNGLRVLANYQYLSSYLERLVRRSSGTPLNLNRICNDVCAFVFSKLKYWTSLSSLKKEIRLKLLNIAKGKQKT